MVYYSMISKEPTYTLWHDGDLIDRQPHTRDTFDDMLEWAYGVDGTVEIFSSRDDLVWSSRDDSFAMTPNEQNECGMTDVEADADTLASAGYGTDEDYGYYGDDCYDY